MNKNAILLAIAATIIIIGGGLFFYFRRRMAPKVDPAVLVAEISASPSYSKPMKLAAEAATIGGHGGTVANMLSVNNGKNQIMMDMMLSFGRWMKDGNLENWGGTWEGNKSYIEGLITEYGVTADQMLAEAAQMPLSPGYVGWNYEKNEWQPKNA